MTLTLMKSKHVKLICLNMFLLTLDQLDQLANSNAKPVNKKPPSKYTSLAYSEDSMFVGQTKPVKIQPGGFRDKTNKLKILNSFKMPVCVRVGKFFLVYQEFFNDLFILRVRASYSRNIIQLLDYQLLSWMLGKFALKNVLARWKRI